MASSRASDILDQKYKDQGSVSAMLCKMTSRSFFFLFPLGSGRNKSKILQANKFLE